MEILTKIYSHIKKEHNLHFVAYALLCVLLVALSNTFAYSNIFKEVIGVNLSNFYNPKLTDFETYRSILFYHVGFFFSFALIPIVLIKISAAITSKTYQKLSHLLFAATYLTGLYFYDGKYFLIAILLLQSILLLICKISNLESEYNHLTLLAIFCSFIIIFSVFSTICLTKHFEVKHNEEFNKRICAKIEYAKVTEIYDLDNNNHIGWILNDDNESITIKQRSDDDMFEKLTILKKSVKYITNLELIGRAMADLKTKALPKCLN